jgi:cobalt/nickel transport system permease protein
MKPEFRSVTIFFLLIIMLFLLETPAFAMHISEGILPPQWAILWFAVSGPFLFLGLRELRRRGRNDLHLKPMVGLVGAAVFIISCMPIPVPTAGTCSHPCGTGIAAIFIGPLLTVVVTSVALLLQALFLAHGGLSTLGADLCSMGVAGAFAGYGTFILVRKLTGRWWAAAFLAGILSDWATYAVTSLQLSSALHGSASFGKFFLTVLLAFVPTQLPLGILEGFLCVGAYKFIMTRRPELLKLFSAEAHS